MTISLPLQMRLKSLVKGTVSVVSTDPPEIQWSTIKSSALSD